MVGGLVAAGAAGLGLPAAAAPGQKKSRREYQARYRELFTACGTDLDKKALVGKQMLDDHARDARAYHAPDRAAVARMHTALARQYRSRRIGVNS